MHFGQFTDLLQHELMPLELAADSPSPILRIADLSVLVKLGTRGKQTRKGACSPPFSKLLARLQGRSGLGGTGHWVERNSEGLALYALARYVTAKNGSPYHTSQ